MRRILVALVLTTAACTAGNSTTGDPPKAPAGDGFSRIVAVDERTLLVTFARTLDKGTARADVFKIHDRTVIPFQEVAVEGANAGDADVTLTTGAMEPGRTYTLTIQGLKDAAGYALDGTLNFTGGGSAERADVTFTLDDPARVEAWGELALEVTADPVTGQYSDRTQRVAFTSEGTTLRATVRIAADSRRTVERRDDADPVVDRRAYAVRVVTEEAGLAASPLFPFEVRGAQPVDIAVTLMDPPMIPVGPGDDYEAPEDPTPGDGKKRVRIIVDDRLSRELESPAVKVYFDAEGNFDLINPRTLPLLQPVEPRLYEVTLDVKVDPNRTVDGVDENTLPYVTYLVNNGEDIDAINVSIVAPDEEPQAVVLPLGDATRTPVTFRIDVANAFLVPDGSQRGIFPEESVFLTGEWQSAADALGRNAGDAFSGGEQRTLEMKEDPEHPGVWFKTIWLTPGRPYGWKVVRCQSGVGCGPLNQLVASSGRAFPTVMKNLATEITDAFADPDVAIVDPGNLSAVPLPSGNADYSGASVYVGNGMGPESNPPWAPRSDTLFKQEVPDLAVVVGDTPIVTPIYVVGTWRDVNAAQRPAEILQTMQVLDITPGDYDTGFIGRYPPSRSEP